MKILKSIFCAHYYEVDSYEGATRIWKCAYCPKKYKEGLLDQLPPRHGKIKYPSEG